MSDHTIKMCYGPAGMGFDKRIIEGIHKRIREHYYTLSMISMYIFPHIFSKTEAFKFFLRTFLHNCIQ